MSRLLVACAMLGVVCGCGSSDASKSDPLWAERDYDIYLAAEAGDLEGVQRFIAAGEWDHQVTDVSGMTPLHAAAQGGNPDVIRLMVQQGAWVDMPDLQGRTPLQVARQAGNAGAVQALMDLGARDE